MDLSIRDEILVDDDEVYEAPDEITDEEIYRNAMPNSPSQFELMLKLVLLIRYMYRNETCFVIADMPIVPPRPRKGQPPYGFKFITPDVSVFKGVYIPQPYPVPFGSWRMRKRNRPAPNVVIEIASDKTWREDVKADKKPARYERLGVKEYFACDPDGFWTGYEHRLLGWRYKNGQRIELFPNEDGKIWSEELNSDLRVEGKTLNLYDEHGNLRKVETDVQKEIIADKERQVADKERQVADKERQVADKERQVADRDAIIKALQEELRKARGEN